MIILTNYTIGNSSKEEAFFELPFTVQVSNNLKDSVVFLYLVKNIEFEIDKYDLISKSEYIVLYKL